MYKTVPQMQGVLKAYVAEAGSQKAAASALKLSQTHVSEMLRGKRDISDNVARKLGFTRVMVFEPLKESA